MPRGTWWQVAKPQEEQAGDGEGSPAPGQATCCLHPAPSSATTSQHGLRDLPVSLMATYVWVSHRPALLLGTCVQAAAMGSSQGLMTRPGSWNNPRKERNPSAYLSGSWCLGGKGTLSTKWGEGFASSRRRISWELLVPLVFLHTGEGRTSPELSQDSKDRESTLLMEQLCQGLILLSAASVRTTSLAGIAAALLHSVSSMWLHPGAW